MVCKELKDPNYSAIIARKLATVHQLNVPINKEATWLVETFQSWLAQVRNYQRPKTVEKVHPLERELLAFDFEGEWARLVRLLATVPSPIVFCHNDLQEGNILLPADVTSSSDLLKIAGGKASSSTQNLDDHIVFIDFEFCAYNYRGFDLGNHFCERMFDYNNEAWPHFHAYMEEFPGEEEMRRFIGEYLRQSAEMGIAVDEQLDTEEHLLREAEFYALASHFLWILWSINNARNSKIAFGYLVCAAVLILLPGFFTYFSLSYFHRSTARRGCRRTTPTRPT